MKSKPEVIDALKRCKMREWSCDECSYFPLGDHCWDALHSDILELLNKSDFEVMEEIFSKSNKTLCGVYTAANGHHVLEIHPRLDDDYRAVIRFDEEDNIL